MRNRITIIRRYQQVKSKSSIDLPTDEVSDTTGDEQRQKDGKQIISEIL